MRRAQRFRANLASLPNGSRFLGASYIFRQDLPHWLATIISIEGEWAQALPFCSPIALRQPTVTIAQSPSRKGQRLRNREDNLKIFADMSSNRIVALRGVAGNLKVVDVQLRDDEPTA